jgi:polar amino acid transport system substrate-binding protein
MIHLFFVSIFVLISTTASAQNLNDIQWLSEQYPPYNFVENNKPQGISFDVLIEILDLVGIDKNREDIKFMPWARSYKLVQKQPGTAVFSMTYTEERSKLFKFVGPILPSRVSLIAKKSRNLKINSARDMDQLKIGVVREDIGEHQLRELNVKRGAIKQSNHSYNIIQKLDKDRLDCIAYAKDVTFYIMKKYKIDPGNYEEVYLFQEGELYYAFHKETKDSILQPLQEALNSLKADGTVKKIIKKYIE